MSMPPSFPATVLAVLVSTRATYGCSPEEGWRMATTEEQWSAAAWVVSGDVVATVDCVPYYSDGVDLVDPTGAGEDVDLAAMCDDLGDWGQYGFALVRNLSWSKGKDMSPNCVNIIVSGFSDGAMCGVGLPWNVPDGRGSFFLCDVDVDARNANSGTCIARLNTRGDIHVGYASASDFSNVEPTCPQDGTCKSVSTCKVGGPDHVPYEGSGDMTSSTGAGPPKPEQTKIDGDGVVNKNSPPSICKFNKKMFVEDTLNQDEALCSSSDGGWKYGINNMGKFGLWDDKGELVKIYDEEANWMELYEDDDDIVIWVYNKDGDYSWEMYCGSNQKYEAGKIMLRINPNARNVVRLTATDPPLHNLMRIKKDGKVQMNEKFCSVTNLR